MTAPSHPPQGSLIGRDRDWQPKALTPSYKTSVKRSPQSALLSFPSSLSEETGPVFSHERLGPLDNDMILNFAAPDAAAIGPRIIVHGRVTDQDGRPISGALVEAWQANAAGRYRHKNDSYLAPLDPNFGGCGRALTGEDGHYEFRTIHPGAYPWPNGPNDWRPSHIHFSVFGASFGQRLITQMYFEGDPLIPLCPIIGAIEDPEAIKTLIAPLDMSHAVPMDSLSYRFDIVLRGRRQTLFENRPEGL